MLRIFVFILCFGGIGHQVSQADCELSGYRFWYDSSCKHRFPATISSSNGDRACLSMPNGKFISNPVTAFSHSDQAYLRAFNYSLKAISKLNNSPYLSSDRTLAALGQQLETHNVSSALTSLLTCSTNPNNDHFLNVAKERWVEIKGIQYQVASIRLSESVTGIEELVVFDEHWCQQIVPPQDVQKITILPVSRRKAVFHPMWTTQRPFRRRGPGSINSFSEDVAWKYELVYDPIMQVWTDIESASAHRFIQLASNQWTKSSQLELIAEARWHLHQGKDLAANNSFTEALRHFSVSIEKAPNYAEAYLQRGYLQANQKRGVRALDDYTQAIHFGEKQKNAGYQRLHVLVPAFAARAKIYSSQHKHDLAIADVQEAAELNPDRGNKLYKNLAFKLKMVAAKDFARIPHITLSEFRNGGQPSEEALRLAIELADKAAKYNPDKSLKEFEQLALNCRRSLALHFGRLARDARKRNRYQDAIAYATSAIESNPEKDNKEFSKLQNAIKEDAFKFYSQRAVYALNASRLDDAVDNAERTKQFSPGARLTEANELLKLCYFARAKRGLDRRLYSNSEKDASAYIEIDSSNPNVFTIRAICRLNLNSNLEAISDMDIAISLNDKIDSLYYLRAIGHLREGSFSNAERDFISAIRLNSNASSYHFELAKVHVQLDKIQPAIDDVSRAIEIDQRTEYLIYRSKLHLRLGNFDAAKADASRAGLIAPDSLEVAALTRSVEQQDPHYFVSDNVSRAAANLLAAFASQAIIQRPGEGAIVSAVEDVERQEGVLGKIGALIANAPKVALGATAVHYGSKWKEQAIENAINEVFPRLPYVEGVALRNVLSEILGWIGNGRSLPDDMQRLFGKVRTGITTDVIVDLLEEEQPQLKPKADAAIFIHKLIKLIEERDIVSINILHPRIKRIQNQKFDALAHTHPLRMRQMHFTHNWITREYCTGITRNPKHLLGKAMSAQSSEIYKKKKGRKIAIFHHS